MSFFGEFFDALPSDHFLPWEEDLRAVLLSTVNKNGRQLLSKIVAHPKSTKIAVTAIEKWIRKRVGAEFEVRRSQDQKLEVIAVAGSNDESNGQLIEREEHEAVRRTSTERFFMSLPPETFLPEEHAMWLTLYNILCKVQCPIRLCEIERNLEVARVRVAFLPENVTISEWCTRRAPCDFEITDGPDIPTLCLSRRLEGRRPKNLNQEVDTLMVCNEERSAQLIEKAERNAQRKETIGRFFSTLPQDVFSPEEHAMWTVLYDILSKAQCPIRLCDIGRNVEVKSVRSALLPEGVTIREWCVQRAAHDFEIGGGRDNATLCLSRQHMSPPKRLRYS